MTSVGFTQHTSTMSYCHSWRKWDKITTLFWYLKILQGEVRSLLNSYHRYTYFKYTLGKEKAVTQEPVLAILTLNPIPNYPSVSQREKQLPSFQGLIFKTAAAQQLAKTQVWLFGARLGQFFTCLYFASVSEPYFHIKQWNIHEEKLPQCIICLSRETTTQSGLPFFSIHYLATKTCKWT